MNKFTFITVFFFLITAKIFSQVNFEKGYFINNNNQKTTCFIKNEDWKNNPSKFEYKLAPEGETKILRIQNLKTVAVDGAFKFEKHTVPYDNSNRAIAELTDKRTPDFKDVELLLKVLIEGKSTLYSFVDGDKKAFYYKLDDGNISPLIYKVYTNKDRNILYNKRYQQQLLTEFSCAGITENRVLRVGYNKSDLRDFFKLYNECNGETVIEFDTSKNSNFHVKILAGANIADAKANLAVSPFFRNGIDTRSDFTPTFGVELEYIFPFNKNKWSLFFAPNYGSYKGESNTVDLASRKTFKFSYSELQLPIGFRHYMYINNHSKVFFSGAVVFAITLAGEASGNTTLEKDQFAAATGFSLGLGYSYKKYSVEAKYSPNRQLLNTGIGGGIKLKQFSIVLGYSIF